MSDTSSPPPNWYPDPGGTHEQRYWDGSQWTDHVADHGRQSEDPLTDRGGVPTTGDSADRIQQQVSEKAGVRDTGTGDGTIWSEPVLVVNQKVKLIELNNVGLSPLEALRAATTTAAELFGIEDRVGRIEPGLEADLIVLERDPLQGIEVVQDVLMVVSDGAVVIERGDWAGRPVS